MFGFFNLASYSAPCVPLEPIFRNITTPPDDACGWKFEGYVPSEWETAWTAAIEERRTRVCAILANETELIVEYMKHVINWSNANLKSANQTVGNRVFSRMVYYNNCTKQYAAQLIEPLIGMLRDPTTMCPDNPQLPSWLTTDIPDGPVQSKRFNLFAINAPYGFGTSKAAVSSGNLELVHPPTILFGAHGGLKVLYDLGANYFNQWGGDTQAYSTAYFYLLYQSRKISFDRVFAYEYQKLDPHKVWDVVPAELLYRGAYTMINHGVENGVGNRFNPWTTIKATLTPWDHLVFKLDIDTPVIENALMEELLNDPRLLSLVDEMFFEHHVYIPEMQPYWGIGPDSSLTLATSYSYYSRLRQRGVRMHSWP